jgi:NAD(P)-dependent dehydrogenase (short-subunit alcohol dehydrogenase family)
MTEKAERVAIVTGAGHGIGREIAIQLAADGITVVVADLNPEWSQAVASEIGENAFGYRVDVRDKESIAALVTAVIDRFGQIDILVNNAGIYPNSPFLETSEDEWDAVFDTNLKGMFLVSQAVAREMTARGTPGRIVNLSSGASVSGRAGAAHYCSSKAAINMLTKVMAIELTPKGITVNAVAPGLVEVPDWEHAEEYINAIVSGIPAGRIGQPADIARAVTFLVSPDADFISGSVLFVDGGSSAGRTTLPLSRRPVQ